MMIVNDRSEIGLVASLLRRQGKTIVTAGGCFDLLHVGHVSLLEQASKLGDVLWILTNVDESLSRLKPDRPILPLTERQIMLGALRAVDYVSSFHEDTPCEIMEVIQPHVHVKGEEYRHVTIPEEDVIGEWNGQIEYIPLLEGYSTSLFLERVRDGK